MTRAGSGAEQIDLVFSLVMEVEGPAGIGEVELAELARSVLAAEGASGRWEITVALVGDERLQALHRDFMGIDTPTDIMTFPVADGDEGYRGGDLVISVDHARSQSGAWGLSPTEEILFLVVHGLLHVLGWRDDSKEPRDRMLDRQQVLFDRWRAVE